MTLPVWQLQIPVSAIAFDCDGTLSTIEGVNELAKKNGVYHEVEALTTQAMGETGINPELYQKRLKLIYPRKEEVYALAQQYFLHQVPDVSTVILLLQRLHKSIYLLSAGLSPAVIAFGQLLQIPAEHIFSVDIQFDQEGNYLDFDEHSPLINHLGKRTIIHELKTKHETIIHIGDGLNDYVTHDLVTRFIGYGGVFYREKLANQCDYYIHTPSLASLLPLVLTQNEYDLLKENEKLLFQKGLSAIYEGKVSFPKKKVASILS